MTLRVATMTARQAKLLVRSWHDLAFQDDQGRVWSDDLWTADTVVIGQPFGSGAWRERWDNAWMAAANYVELERGLK